VIVGLSDCDEIVDAPKVKRHIDLFVQRRQQHQQQQQHRTVSSCNQRPQQRQQQQSIQTIYWEQAGHANCLQSPSKWRDIQHSMRECEYMIATTKRNVT
jgi:hypothetical protein